MKKTKRLKLTTMQSFTHYAIVIGLLFCFSMTGWSVFEIYVTDSYTGELPTDELINISLIFLSLALFFAVVQYQRLKFQEINVTYTDEQFQEAIDRTIQQLELRIERNNKTFFRAIRPWNWTGSWGEMITIIKDENRLLINSICDPDQTSSIVSYGWNRKNVTSFLKNLNDVLNDKPLEIKLEKEINEWGLKSFLKRLIAYPTCLFLIFMGVLMLSEPVTFRTIISGLVLITIAGIYLYSDLKILSISKMKRKKR